MFLHGTVALRGRHGLIAAGGYQTAARLSAWTVRKAKHGAPWQMRGTALWTDPLKCRYAGLLFVVPRKGGFWSFPVLHLTVNGSSVGGTLGPPEVG